MEKKTIKQTIISISTSVILFAGVVTTINGKGYTALFAHDAQLEVLYDSCIPDPYDSNTGDIGDCEDEKWYLLDDGYVTRHIGNTSGPTEIKYYVYDTSPDGTISWNYISNSTRREYVKNSLINSILKWDSVILYKPIATGIIAKHKLLNFSEGTIANHNLSIYPNTSSSWIGICGPSSTSSWELIDMDNGIEHKHYDKWEINFELGFHQNYSIHSEAALSWVGAHEFGHVLGLVDIDGCENSLQSNYHHEELLMGYWIDGDSFLAKQPDITYKDLIGAAITRGLHTDNDHQWIYYSSGHGVYKLVCSICNGVKYVNSLDGIDYVDYKDCNDEHDLADGNMFAVASYGDSDYYKCKYCRYVAPFTAIEEQDYDYEEYSSTQHLVTNQVEGLEYSFYENHTFDTTHTCTLCGAQYSHSYTHHYENYSSTHHEAYCECGASVLDFHAANFMQSYIFNGHIYAPCIFCSATLDLGGNGPIIPVPGSINQMVTDNGSYIMPNGIYVIVEEDLESYLNGTLAFHPYGEIGA